jgi:hypothetical protein
MVSFPKSQATLRTRRLRTWAKFQRAVGLGDTWRMGPHRLICGDALDPKIVSILMEGEKAEMVFTDPPYNVAIAGNVSGLGKVQHREFAMASGEMTRAEFVAFLFAALRLNAPNRP